MKNYEELPNESESECESCRIEFPPELKARAEAALRKERVTVNLDGQLLFELDALVSANEFRNRSHAMESLIKKGIGESELETAFILAGGKGSKLRPLTYEVPKAMIPVKGKPVLEYLVQLLEKHKVKNIVIGTGYLHEKIENHFGNGEKFGVNIAYSRENKKLGTGGALRKARGLLGGEHVLVSNGDELKDVNITEMHNAHVESGATATMALTTAENSEDFGNVRMEGSRVVEFVEKPKKTEPGMLVSAGLYIMNRSVLQNIPKSKASLEKDLFPKLAETGELSGFVFGGQFLTADTPERYEKAIKHWGGIK